MCRCIDGAHVRFEIYLVSGNRIPTGHYSTRIYPTMTVGMLFRTVANLVEWPASHVQLLIGCEKFSGRSSKLLSDFCTAGEAVRITVIKLEAPSDYRDYPSMCLCDFGGCCVIGVPGRCDHTGGGCCQCGNTGCCRWGNCGHECCEMAAANRSDANSAGCHGYHP